MSSEAPTDSRIGELIAGGQYRVLSRLGAGSFGTVYKVETLVGSLQRALKVLDARWAKDADTRDRFSNEATVLEEINHPNVARCYAAGYLDGKEQVYLLLELIDGSELSQLFRGSAEPLEPRRAVRLANQIASGLDAAHRAGVLHRDLKPDNVMVVDEGSPSESVKVVDFGIAKLMEAGQTSTMTVAGTPAYMAPEQFEPGKPLDARTDIYALGATLFKLLTGKGPYGEPGASVASIMAKQISHRELGRRPSTVVAELAQIQALDLLVASMLSCDPDKRPNSAAEVCDELVRIGHSLNPHTATRDANGLLRALCATPSESAWLALLGYLSTVSELQDEVEIADRLLSQWPDSLRRATNALWETTRKGHAHSLWPLVRTLDLSGRGLEDKDMSGLAANPALASLRRLDLSDNTLSNDGVATLCGSKHLRELRHLNLSQNRISSKGLAALVESGATPRLSELLIADNGIGAKGAKSLAEAKLSLRCLALANNDLGQAGVAALAETTALQSLRKLSLAGNRIGPQGVAPLALATMPHLEVLDLSRNDIGPGGAATLALSETLPVLRSLRLAQNNLGREGLKLLLSARSLGQLEELDLNGNKLGAAGAMLLAGSPAVRRLSSLAVGNNDLGDAGLAALLGSAHLSGLRSLDISQNAFGAASLALLSEAPPQLEQLDLSRNSLTSAGADMLAQSIGRLRVRRLAIDGCELDGAGIASVVESARLDSLSASNNPIGPHGAGQLASSPGLDRIEALDLCHCQLGSEGVGELLGRLPQVRSLDLCSNGLGDEGAELLVSQTPRLPRLETLRLSDNELGARAALALAASPAARHLIRLDLSLNRLCDAGAEAIANAPGWPSLTELVLRSNKIGLSGASALKNATATAFVQSLSLADNALSGEVDMHSLGKDKVSLMEESFALLAPMGADLAEQFYEELFKRFPAVRPLFARTDMARQQEHLLSALVLTIDNLRNPELLESTLRDLGKRHLRYGVVSSHYFAVTSTLLSVIRHMAGEAWNEELEEAWSEGLRGVSTTMMRATTAAHTGPTGP